MIIRELIAGDAEDYYTLRQRSEQEFPQFVGFSAERELAAGPSNVEAMLAAYPAEGTNVWGAFDGIQLVGVLALSRRLSPK